MTKEKKKNEDDSFVPKLMLIGPKGEKYFYKDSDLHTKNGLIKKEKIDNAKPGDVLESNIGDKLLLSTVNLSDRYRKIKRGAQIIPLKDLGLIVAKTGIGKDSIVVDSGAGSGGSSCFFARFVKKVYSFDIREDFLKIAAFNAKKLGLNNVEYKLHSIYDGILIEKKADLIMLDVPEPWKAVMHAANKLKSGGFLVSYSPCIPQVMDFCLEVEKHDKEFLVVQTFEVMEKEWDVIGRKVRPRSVTIGHSGFITLVRRI